MQNRLNQQKVQKEERKETKALLLKKVNFSNNCRQEQRENSPCKTKNRVGYYQGFWITGSV